MNPERIEELKSRALRIADDHVRYEPDRLHIRGIVVELAAALREAQAENERLRGLEQDIRTALDHWPAEAHLGATYYTLVDALKRVAVARDTSEQAERIARGRGIDEANERQRQRAALAPADEAKR